MDTRTWESTDSTGERRTPLEGRARSPYEFYLLDPATGELTKVNGDFRPFQERAGHKLPVRNAVDEVWTALPSALEEAPETVVGRYNTRNFTFVERLGIFGVRFSNTEMKVDEAKHRLTFITNGDILRLALPE